MADFSGVVDTIKGWLGEGKKTLFGDPAALKQAYDDAFKMSQTGSQQIKDFLLGQQGKAQQYYAPIQNLFNSAYGTTGIAAPQTPQAPGGRISDMFSNSPVNSGMSRYGGR